MDDTQQSRVSDAAAAATRKRRSSILKSQRPARTPFSELEFNVATPTDTAKSRRVSFSRRTGVAEFVTNEATTTWKNFYEEHNKSLESSSNDSEANGSRQPVGHLGKRIFDQQFEEVEAVDFMSGLANGSLNNVNFSQQLASLECTEGKLTAPNNKFELSAFTEQSKLFGSDFIAPLLGENSGRIDVNFSAIQQVEKDDLDEIEKDLERGSNSMGCHGPFSDRQNMSEYIEVDLNMTHVVKNDEDMSITDTVHSPVQDVSKSVSIDKKASLNNDWVADKENIAINPYAAPCETNFAVNEEPDQVLVFDGKRLTLQPDKPEKDKNYRQTLLPNSSAETPQRKAIVLNVNDDLPNFLDDMLNSKCENSGFSGFQEIKSNEDEISDTLQLSRVQNKPKRMTIHDNMGNISMTQALPTNIICQAAVISQDANPNRRTIVFDKSSNDISVTEAIPVKLLSSSESMTQRRRTVVYEDDTGNISITQAVPSNIIVNENADTDKREEFDDDKENKLVAQALSSNNSDEKANKRKTIVFNDDDCNVSFTQAVPSNIVLAEKLSQEKRRTIIYENDTGDISVTQALPTNVILPNVEPNPERRRTVVYDENTGDISVTQALPLNILLENFQSDTTSKENDEAENIPTTQSKSDDITAKDSDASRRRTIVHEDDTGNISITQAIPAQLIPGYNEDKPVLNTTKKTKNRKRTTIVYDNDDGDVSTTEAIPVNIIEEAEAKTERKTIVFDENEANISMTLAISTNVFLLDNLDSAVDVIQPEESKEVDVKRPEESKEVDVKRPEESTEVDVKRPEESTEVDVKRPEESTEVDVKRPEESKEVDGKRPEESKEVDVKRPEESKEIKEKVTNYEVYEESLKSPVEPLQDERKPIADMNECDMSITMAISKVPSLRELEKGDLSVTKPIPAKLITCTEVSDKLKDKLLDLTEPDQIISHQSDVIVLQTSRNNSKPTLQTSMSEQTELRKIGDIYNDIFKDSSDMKITSTTIDADDVTRSPLGDVKSSASLIHPRVEEKVNQLSLVTNDWNIDNIAAGEDDAMMQTDAEENQESLINTELSLSVTTIDSGTEDKNIMTRVDSPTHNPSIKKSIDDNTSIESMFYVTKDYEDDARTDRDMDSDGSKTTKPKGATYNQLPLLQLEEDLEAVDVLQKKLAELQTGVSQNQSKKFYEKVDTPDLEEVVELDEDDNPRKEHSYKRADDTQELLNMLSNLTDHIGSDNDIGPVIAKVRASEIAEHKHLSFAPRRQSIVLSREDLLSNISMAQAALQKSRLALDDSDSPEDDTKDSSVNKCSKSDRASNDVVKTLNFNDESISEESLNEYSPLKKTAFGETSYMHETKGKVIPTYLKDVSDGIKELMLDLVKPVNNDNLPFETGVVDKGSDVPMVGSTQSTQIQANLATSSQIDIDYDTYSNAGSKSDLRMGASNIYKSRSLRSPVRFSGNLSESDGHDSKEKWLHTHTPAEQSSAVLIFDHQNPLNNVLLPSFDFTEAHKYNPMKSSETLCVLELPRRSPLHLSTSPPTSPHTHSIGIHYDRSSRDDNSRDFEVQTVTTKKQKAVTRSSVTNTNLKMSPQQSKVTEEVTVTQKPKVSPESSPAKVVKENKPKRIVQHRPSRPVSLDQSVDAVLTKSKDDEVNTTIAMKRNKELLEASSSLTLVDDALEVQTSPVRPDKEFSNQRIRFSRSHLVNIEEQAAEVDSSAKFSEISLQDNYTSNSTANSTKGKKRIYSPATNKHKNHSIQVTPKPVSKMQKISSSPKVQIRVPMELSSTEDSAHSMEPEKDENRSGHTSKTRDKRSKRSPKSRTAKPGQTITVRQLIADCISFDTGFQHINDFEEKNILGVLDPKSGSLAELSQSDVSFTSSKDLKSMKDILSTENMEQSPHQSSMQVMPSRVVWRSEMMYTSSSQCDSESSVNVVAKIDMLPFMGSHECEWEPSSSADTWSFRLLHGRLRLTARLAHRLDNATRTRVRGDTPVLDVAVEAVQHDRKNTVATMCVCFACETIRHMVARALRNKCCARDIPPLLRRCAAAVRVALRWGRAMHDAKLHLAYTMDKDGNLSLKVANIPLRSIWEVTMRIELVLEDKQAVPYPRACGVRVLPVVSDVLVPDADVQRALANTPKDWGHAPRTIWKVFRLLKHKKRDD